MGLGACALRMAFLDRPRSGKVIFCLVLFDQISHGNGCIAPEGALSWFLVFDSLVLIQKDFDIELLSEALALENTPTSKQ